MSIAAALMAVALFTIIGVAFGILTGLVPGIHVNTVAALILAFQAGVFALVVSLGSFFGAGPSDAGLLVSVLIIGMVVTHTFLDIIPSVFLGAPNEDTALSVLPGHRMVKQGRGYEAIRASAMGSFGAVFFALVAVAPARLLMGSPVFLYEKLISVVAWILIGVSGYMILGERSSSRKIDVCGGTDASKANDEEPVVDQDDSCESIETPGVGDSPFEEDNEDAGLVDWSKWESLESPAEEKKDLEDTAQQPGFTDHLRQKLFALAIFLMTGLLGIIVLRMPIHTHNILPFPELESSMLFPLFTGLFGIAGLMLSLWDETEIVEQDTENASVGLSPQAITKGVAAGSLAGSMVGWLPGISSASATVVAQALTNRGEKEDADKEFLVAVSGVNTSNAIMNILALFVILRARSGALQAVAVVMGSRVVEWEPFGSVPGDMVLLLLAVVIAGFLALWLTLFIGRWFASQYHLVPYRQLTEGIIILLVVLVALFTGPVGLAILAVGTCIGLLPPLVGVQRVHMMGCIVVPVVLYFLGV